MTDAATIAAGLQSLKTAFEIGKALLKLGISADIRAQVSEMNERILAAQESAIASREYQSALLSQIDNLEKNIAELETWDAEAETYQLTDIGDLSRTGLFAYAPKAGTHTAEPPHLLCQECFQNRHKSVLQKQELNGRIPALICQHCKNVIYLTGTRPDPSGGVGKRPMRA